MPLENVLVATSAVPLTDTVVRTEMTGRRPVSLTHGDHVTGLGASVMENTPFWSLDAGTVASALYKRQPASLSQRKRDRENRTETRKLTPASTWPNRVLMATPINDAASSSAKPVMVTWPMCTW